MTTSDTSGHSAEVSGPGYEYTSVPYGPTASPSVPPAVSDLNCLGAAGWRVVAATVTHFLLERELSSPE